MNDLDTDLVCEVLWHLKLAERIKMRLVSKRFKKIGKSIDWIHNRPFVHHK